MPYNEDGNVALKDPGSVAGSVIANMSTNNGRLTKVLEVFRVSLDSIRGEQPEGGATGSDKAAGNGSFLDRISEGIQDNMDLISKLEDCVQELHSMFPER